MALKTPVFALVGWWLLGAGPALAQADPDCSGERPWVAVLGSALPALAVRVRSELRAGLAPSNIEVCGAAPPGSPEPLARVTIEPGRESGSFRVDVVDSVTQKGVGRDLALAELPADGRPLAVAVAAEELLRASWAELALRGARSSPSAPPPEVRAVVEPRPAAAPRRRHVALGARLGFEHFTGGQTHYGGEAFVLAPTGAVVAGFLALGGRRALSTQATHGSIDASALSGELGVALTFLRRGGLDVGGFVSARALRLTFEPNALPSGVAERESGAVLTSRGGLVLAFGSRGFLRSYSAAGAGLPLRSFSASDAGTVVTGASALELFLSTGLAVELP